MNSASSLASLVWSTWNACSQWTWKMKKTLSQGIFLFSFLEMTCKIKQYSVDWLEHFFFFFKTTINVRSLGVRP